MAAMAAAAAGTIAGCDLDEVEVKNDKGAAYQTESQSRGTRVMTAPDGSKVTIHRDGTIIKPDGSKMQVKRDGTIIMPNGSRVRVFPDGSRSTLAIERTEFRSDGATVVTAEDGSKTVIAADGSVSREFADGTKSRLTIEKPAAKPGPAPITPAPTTPAPTTPAPTTPAPTPPAAPAKAG